MRYQYQYIHLEDLIDHSHDYLAHLSKDKTKQETLFEHMERTKKYMELLLEANHLKKIVINMIEQLKYKNKLLNKEAKQLLWDCFINGIYLHDLGKINPNFQAKQMQNNKFQTFHGQDKHSLLSALLYQSVLTERLDKLGLDNNESSFSDFIIYSFSYMISRHHTDLDESLKHIEALNDLERSYKENYAKNFKKQLYPYLFHEEKNLLEITEKLDESSTSILFILCKLFYSILIGCDYYATYDFMTGSSMDAKDLGLMLDVNKIKGVYESKEIFKKIQQYEMHIEEGKGTNPFTEQPINALRSDMFIEATNNLKANKDKNIFYLEAPTGSGKTNTSINLALHLLDSNKELNKIFYIFPFNTLVEQTYEALSQSFGGDLEATIINSITPIKKEIINKNDDKDDEVVDYDKGYLNYIFLHYPLIITTHVRLFNMLFGTNREESIPLSHLANSVIIIDEVQSYKIKLWKEIIYFFNMYSRLLNMKIIIMSATLPRLDLLLEENIQKASYVNLIKDRDKYFGHDLFKKRVKLDFSLLDEGLERDTKEEKLQALLDKVVSLWIKKGRAKILVEFLTTSSAREFYKLAKERLPDKVILELTGSDNKNERERIINQVKYQLEDCLLITTQVIEAGVDIDMDIGFKSISFLDAEEQFLGRINRPCMKEGYAYFFDIDEAKTVYRSDFRIDKNLYDPHIRKMLEDKDFSRFYQLAMKDINDHKSECNSANFELTKDEISLMKFKEIEKKMKLIDDQNTVTLFLNVEETINKEKVKGKDVWHAYLELIHNKEMGFTEKKTKLSEIKGKINYFTYTLYVRTRGGQPVKPDNYTQCIGDLYYFEEGETLREGKKFSKEEAYKLFKSKFNDSDFM